METQVEEKVQTIETKVVEDHNMVSDKEGKMSWIYELPMLKSFFLLFEVWKVLGMAAAVVVLFSLVLNLIEGNGLDAILASVGMGALVLGILLVLSLPAYYIVTRANNGKYTVLFEMDENGVDHIQIKTDKAKALDLLTIGVGVMHKSLSTAAAGLRSASGTSLYSSFSKVKKIKAYRKHNLIRVNGTLIHNQVYADDAHFDYVYNYIVEHCPNAKIG